MNNIDRLELFVLKCASIKIALDDKIAPPPREAVISHEPLMRNSIEQFTADLRDQADRMAEYYRLFYMLENDIRRLIDETVSEAYGVGWWVDHAPNSAKEECRQNQQRELEAGVTSRSDNELDYISFGQLGDIIRHNWVLFGGILSNEKALGRVMFALNTLRGPIAHCGVLAEDEVDRLKLAVKDWFRLLEGPK